MPELYPSQIIFNNNSVMDLTNDTVSPEHVENGYTFHAANGAPCVGTMAGGGGGDSFTINVAEGSGEYRLLQTKMDYALANNSTFNKPLEIGDNIISLSHAFEGCSEFNQQVNIPNNVSNIVCLFNGCSSFNQNVDINDNLNNMYGVFSGCSSLNQNIKIPSTGYNLSNMFSGCSSLNYNIQIPQTGYDLSNIFSGCSSLDQNMSILENANNIEYMFSGCSSLNQNMLIPENYNNISGLFSNCSSLNINITIPDSVVNSSNLFYGCSSLDQNITIPNNTKNISGMFSNCNVFNQYIDIPESVQDVSYLFANCNNFNVVDIVSDNYKFTNCKGMFMNCGSLTQTPFYNYSSNLIKDASYMFANCYNIKNISNLVWGSSGGSNFYYLRLPLQCNVTHMFEGCDLSELPQNFMVFNQYDIGFNNVDISYMFHNTNINILTICGANTNSLPNKIINFHNTFGNCQNLIHIIGLHNINNNNIDACDMSYMCYNCVNLVQYNIGQGHPNLYAARNISHMFDNCYLLNFGGYYYNANIHINCMNTVDASYAFSNCFELNPRNGVFFENSAPSSINNASLMKLENTAYMFYFVNYSPYTRTTIQIPISLKNASHMFHKSRIINVCSLNDTYTDGTKIYYCNLEDASYMFAESLDIKPSYGVLPSSLINTSYMFYGITLFNFNNSIVGKYPFSRTFNLKDASHMFDMCYNLDNSVSLNIGTCSNLENASYMFARINNHKIAYPGMNQDTLPNLKDASYMFYMCNNFSPTEFFDIPRNVTNVVGMFYGAKKFANIVNIPEQVTDTSYMFANTNVITPITTIPENVTNTSWMFANCFKCRQKLTLPENVTNTSHMFYRCNDLRSATDVPNNVIDTSYMFYMCNNMRGVINTLTSDKLVNASYMYYGCSLCNFWDFVVPDTIEEAQAMLASCNLKQTNSQHNGIHIPNNAINCGYFFMNSGWERPTTIPNSAVNIAGLFSSCHTFNQPVIIPENVIDAQGLFRECDNYNQPVTIPNNVTDITYMFLRCYNFNLPVTIPENIIRAVGLFYGCINFDQPVTIPNNVRDIQSMFAYCNNFNQSIIIPRSVSNLQNMFDTCENYSNTIYANVSRTANAKGMFSNKNSSHRVNIYCNSLWAFNGNSYSNSITGDSITWTQMTNGVYNAVYNIYLYTNMPEGI